MVNVAHRTITAPQAYDANMLSDSLATLDQNLDKIEIIKGRHIPGVNITTTDTLVAHGLGRTPIGWIVVDQDADARIWRVKIDAQYLCLIASANVSVSLWVF